MSDMGTTSTTSPLDLAEGDFDPVLKKTVGTHIFTGRDFIVYLDQDYFVQWNCLLPDDPPGASEVFNRVGHLETLSLTLNGTEHLPPLRRLLGEAVARLYSDKNANGAEPILQTAEQYLVARSAELARRWYLGAAGVVTALIFCVAIGGWVQRANVAAWLGPTAPHLVLAVGAGALGALLSVISRTSSLHLEAGAGRPIHRIEAAARVMVGAVGAALVVLAVRADLVAGFVNKVENGPYLELVLAFCAGASERFVPGLIKRIETTALGDTKQDIPDGRRGEPKVPGTRRLEGNHD